MGQFQTWFQQHSMYLLPDGTLVIAQYFDFDGRPRWWFVEVHEHQRLGKIVVAVLPNGSVWNYIFQPERGVCSPQCSDLTIDDLRPISPPATVGSWVVRAGELLALLWAIDGLTDLIGAAAALAA
jgi:hypothetical protein